MLHSMLLWLILAQSADISTTAMGLHKGCVEQVYPIHSPDGVVAVKGGSVLVFSLIYPKLKKSHPKLAKGLALVMIGSGTVGAVHNAMVLPRCGG